MTAGPVPTSPLTDLYNNTTPFTTASSSAMDAAIQAIATTLNDNWAAYYAGIQASTLPNPDGSVTTAKIRDGAVTTAKLADLAVTAAKIAVGAIGAAQLDPALLVSMTDIAIAARLSLIDEKVLTSTQIIGNPYKLTKTINKMITGQTVKGICEGDSTTAGDTGAGMSANPFPSVMQTKLRSIYNNSNITIVNKGVNGTRSDQGLATLSAHLATEQPDFCTIMFGINDISGSVPPNNTIDQYRANLVAMVKLCYAAGVEVLIMPPTPSYGLLTGWTTDTNRKIYMYGKAAEEVARAYNTGFYSLHDDLEKIYQSRSKKPSLIMSTVDNLHYSDYGYTKIAELITARVFDLKTSGVLTVDSDKEFSIGACRNKYIDSNCTVDYAGPSGIEFYNRHYSLSSDGVGGTYVNFEFLVTQKDMDLIFIAPKNPSSGKVTIYDNGVSVGDYDCYAQENSLYENENIIIESMDIGYHKIEIKVSNMATGLSVASPYFVSISAFKFAKTKKRNDWLYTTGAGSATVESFKPIITSPTYRLKAPASSLTGVLLRDSDIVQLKTGKTLVFEVEGTFTDKSGVSWFGNSAGTANTLGLGYGYVLGLFTSGMNLYHPTGSNNAATVLASWITTLTFSGTHKIRIEHTAAGIITVYWDGTLVITTSASLKVREGYFGLQSLTPASPQTIEIKRFEYCYI